MESAEKSTVMPREVPTRDILGWWGLSYLSGVTVRIRVSIRVSIRVRIRIRLVCV